MKKILFGLFLGFIVHMLYLDCILIKQHQIIEKCPINEIPNKDNILPCLKYGNDTPDRYYLKYFGLYRLVNWDHIYTGKWKME